MRRLLPAWWGCDPLAWRCARRVRERRRVGFDER